MFLFFFGPFEKLAGNNMSLALERPVTLRELIAELARRLPDFKRFAQMDTDQEISAHISFLSQGKLLRLDDQVHDQDTVQVLLPVTGG